MYDVVYVTFNSEKWIEKCFDSWLSLEFDLKEINVFVVDNASTDNTVLKLRTFEKKYAGKFSSFHIICEQKNWGFGKANNIGAAKGNAEYICFLNVDTELFPDTFKELKEEIVHARDMIGLWEYRQFPYEHPKIYNPVTGECNWSSGAAFTIKRNIFDEVGGFDEKIFMYGEDVDLSWRIRSLGYSLKYAPRVKIYHYSYEIANEQKPNQYIYGVINNLNLRYRFGSISKILEGHLRFWSLILRHPQAFPNAKKLLLKCYWNHFKMISHFRAHGKYRKNLNIANFIGWDYGLNREGAFHVNTVSCQKPLVSIIVRTCGRPSVLRETLCSLRNQTYDNMEIVIIEDGEAISEKMLYTEFSDLNIVYKSTVQKVGRSKAGNIAMEISHGEYLNFLDDDDFFYGDHVEVLVSAILTSGRDAAYALGFETPLVVKKLQPYVYVELEYRSVHTQEFDRIKLCHHNYIPIQCIMFSKKLFLEYGGLDEMVDALEDWDMWLRYSLYTDFAYVPKTTSVYHVPADKELNSQRQAVLDKALLYMREKHKKYMQKISACKIAALYEEHHT